MKKVIQTPVKRRAVFFVVKLNFCYTCKILIKKNEVCLIQILVI